MNIQSIIIERNITLARHMIREGGNCAHYDASFCATCFLNGIVPCYDFKEKVAASIFYLEENTSILETKIFLLDTLL